MFSPVAYLSKNGHCPGAERSLAATACTWVRKHDKLRKTVVFPCCGCGAYELAFLEGLKDHRFETVVMMDNDVHQRDELVWRRTLGPRLVVLHSFGELCSYLQTRSGFNVLFFHKPKEAAEDPCYKDFVELCKNRSGQRHYIHAFNREGKDCVFASPWH